MKRQIDFYYVNARLNGKTALLAGPFTDANEAGACIDACGQLFVELSPLHTEATYGVVRINRHDGLGMYNTALRAAGVNIEVPN